MRPISAFAHMMASTVTVAPRTGQDGYGKPTYGTAITYTAKIYYSGGDLAAARSASVQTVTPSRTIHLMSADAILPTAQLTLSTGDVGSTETWAIHPLITRVERLYDASGAHSTILHT